MTTSKALRRIFTGVALCAVLLGRYQVQAQNPANDQATPAATEVSTTSQPAPDDVNLIVGAGDLISVSVLGAPDFDRQVRVSGDGGVVLPFVGNVQIGGRTVRQAEELIAERLSDGGYFNNPNVSILVKEYVAQGISVLGEVRKPGIYQLLGSHTLLDAISAAGGTTEKAGRAATVTHKDKPNAPETIALPGSADAAAVRNVELHPGDIISISKAGIVYVVGDVRQPTGIAMENPSLTVLQAIAMAQGTNSTAALDKAKLIRKGPDGRKEIDIPLNKILEAKSADVQLLPDDIIFVPNSAAKSAAHRSIDAIIQTVTGIAIYRR